MTTPKRADNGSEKHDSFPAPGRPAAVAAVQSALVTEHRAVMAAAQADNTRRAYRSAVTHYLAWRGVLPADKAAIIRYLLTYAPSQPAHPGPAPAGAVTVARLSRAAGSLLRTQVMPT